MASFVEGLASGLSGLPQALLYRQEKDREDAYKKDIAGLSSADSPFDPEAAARVALKHGDLPGASGYRRMAAEATARSAAGVRQKEQDNIKAEDRTRRMATEDEALLYKRRQRFASRFAPLLKAGDEGSMGRMIAAHPGLIGGLMNFGPDRRAVGVEAAQTPEGGTRYAFQLEECAHRDDGPGDSPNASLGPRSDNVNLIQRRSRSMRGLQPFLTADKGTTEQQNIAGFLRRNPGASEADYFAQKRSPGVSVFTGDQGKARSSSAAYDPVTGTEPGKDRAFQFDPATQKFERNELGLPCSGAEPRQRRRSVHQDR